MKTSDNGRKFIELWEGLFLKTYNDGVGVLTIGYGHTSAAGAPHVYRGMKITQAQADEILSSDLHSCEINVTRHLTRKATAQQFDTFVSMDFNTGGFGHSSLMRDFNAGKLARIEHDLAMWNKAGGSVNRGLVRRRHAEYVLFSTGKLVGP